MISHDNKMSILHKLTQVGGSSGFNVSFFIYNKRMLEELSEEKAPFSKKLLDTHESVDKRNHICFAPIWGAIKQYEHNFGSRADYVTYFCRINNNNKLNMSRWAIRRWLSLCYKNGLIQNFDIDYFMKTQLFNVYLYDYNPKLLYISLCCVRNIQESPNIPIFTLCLMDWFGYDFYLALTMAEFYCRLNAGHSFISLSRPYIRFTTEKSRIETIPFTALAYTIKLKKFINNLHKELRSRKIKNAWRFKAEKHNVTSCLTDMKIENERGFPAIKIGDFDKEKIHEYLY